jgi:phage tail P2-like protein
MNTDAFAYPDGPLSTPWLAWAASPPNVVDGAVTVDPAAYGDATRPESIGPDSFSEILFQTPLDAVPVNEAGLGVRLTSHTSASNGYMLQADGGNLQLLKDFTAPLGISVTTTNVEGLRLVAHGDTIEAWALSDGIWTLQISETDSSYPDAGYTGFWLFDGSGTPPVVESFSWGLVVPAPAAARYYARLEPIAYDDADHDYILRALAAALMAPREVFEVAREDDDGRIPWGRLLDPDACPAELLDWLAVFAGVVLPPSAITDEEKRSRIGQAAGQYRGTNQAMREEIQRSLTGTKSVRIIEHAGGDPWAVVVVTKLSETPDADAVERTAQAQKRAGLTLTYIATDGAVIDEATRTINAASNTINSAVLADVT